MAVKLAKSWQNTAKTHPEFRSTKLWLHLAPLVEGIQETTHRRLSWAARWQVLLTGKIPEDV